MLQFHFFTVKQGTWVHKYDWGPLINFEYGNIWCSQNSTNEPKPYVELGYMYPRWLSGAPAKILTK